MPISRSLATRLTIPAIAVLTIALAAASLASAQDVERAMRVYDCGFLVARKPDLPGPDLRRFPCSGAVAIEEFAEEEGGGFIPNLDPDRLVDLIKGNIEPDSWAHEKNTIQYRQGQLVVVQVPEVLDKIGMFLDELRRNQQRRIHLVGRVLSVRLDHLAALHARVARTGAGAILTPDEVQRLLDVPPGDGRLTVLSTYSLPAASGQLVHAGSVRATHLIRDLDVEVAEEATASDPVLDDLLTGIVLRLRPSLVQGGLVQLQADLVRAATYGEKKVLETGVGRIDLPARSLQAVATTLLVPENHAAFLAVSDAEVDGRVIVFLVEPQVVGPEKTEADGPEKSDQTPEAPTREIRVYDVGFLVVPIEDLPCPYIPSEFPGVSINLDPTEEEGGAIFGCPGVSAGLMVNPEDLIQLIRTAIAEDTWSNTRNSIDLTGGLMMVVQKPEVHAEIARLLDQLRARRGVLVTTKAWAMAVPNDQLAKLFPRLADLGRPLTAEAMGRVHQAIADGSVPVLRYATLTGFNRQRVHAASVLERAVIADSDVEIAKKASTAEPVVRPLRTGFVVDVRPTLAGDGKHIDLDLLALFVAADESRVVPYLKDKPYVVHEYHTETANLLTSAFLPEGGPLAFVRGEVPGRPGHQLLYLVSARSTRVSGRK
jgi:hypothetical protein